MKKWYESRAIWTNLVAIVIVIATALADPNLISPQVAAAAGVTLSVANIVLRLITELPIDTPLQPTKEAE